MDWLWMQIVALAHTIQAGLDSLFAPLNTHIGPAATIGCIALLTVAATKLFSRYKTKRYYCLKAKFEYWFNIRQEALAAAEDPEQVKMLTRNIDKAELNKIYYDFFIEGLLNNLLTMYIPVLCIAAYVNESYKPEKLEAMTGTGYLFRVPGSDTATVGALFWFVICLVSVYLLWTAIKALLQRKRNGATPIAAAGEVNES